MQTATVRMVLECRILPLGCQQKTWGTQGGRDIGKPAFFAQKVRDFHQKIYGETSCSYAILFSTKEKSFREESEVKAG